MKKSAIFLLTLLSMFSSTAVFAKEDQYKIVSIGCFSTTPHCTFNTSPEFTSDNPSCNGKHVIFSTETLAGKNLYAGLLAAFAANKTVALAQLGCDSYYKTNPTIHYFRIQ